MRAEAEEALRRLEEEAQRTWQPRLGALAAAQAAAERQALEVGAQAERAVAEQLRRKRRGRWQQLLRSNGTA